MSFLIKNANIVNENKIFRANVYVEGEYIKTISENEILVSSSTKSIDATGQYLLPGLIDDQVHFREPGLTHKADIYTEAKAAVAGGITSFMEMPNTVPNTLTQELLEQKYQRAAETSLANFSFYMGVSNDNIKEVLKTNPANVCGVKVFMGSSTGNMLVDKKQVLEALFSECKLLIATHCEDEHTIRENFQQFKMQYGDAIPLSAHPLIRSTDACYKSSAFAVELATKYNSRLHILHISTEKELSLFRNDVPSSQKNITAEACIHHLWFSDEDYEKKGNFIKWNPAIKTKNDREAILNGVLNGTIDVIATDHAPHTKEEKEQPSLKAPSGGPLVQHALVALLELYHQQKISLEKVVEKTAHTPSEIFKIENRGYIREGFFADLVLVNLQDPWQVNKSNILYKCAWSPFEGNTFHSKITHTFVNGHLAYEKGYFNESQKGKRLLFKR
ncbi:MAG: dihydroorotase [Flavobacteriales bacterium]|nr:dihydroorotase [Flavobacteriales bacterium]